MKVFSVIVISLISYNTLAQNSTERLDVFLDCSNARCDRDFIRSEINIVNFSLDRISADVHVLITDQRTGSGGREYQVQFYGLNRFSNLSDSITYRTGPNDTDYERRDEMLKNLKAGLIPFLIESGSLKGVTITMKTDRLDTAQIIPVKDPWNYWVFRVGLDGRYSADRNSRDFNYEAEISANRTTEDRKFYFNGEYGENNNIYKYNEGGQENEIEVNNHNYRIEQGWIFSISDHWSYGYEARLSRNTFSNNKQRWYIQPAIEYSIFPYKQVNNKFWTISYGVGFRYNDYFEETIYNQFEEFLVNHTVSMNLSLNQKWGNISSGIRYNNYLHDWSFNSFRLYYEVDVRITGGLSFFTYFSGDLVYDQLYLPKGEATEQDVLARIRELESNYRVSTYFGLNYRFGSDLNNFVNPRFR